jgi:hypothetical protein
MNTIFTRKLNFENRGRNAYKYKQLMDAINKINESHDNKINISLNSPRKVSLNNDYFNTLYTSPILPNRSNNNYLTLKKKKSNSILGLNPKFLLKTKNEKIEFGKNKKSDLGFTNYFLTSELEKFDGMLKRGYKKNFVKKKDDFYDLNMKRIIVSQEQQHREIQKKSQIALQKLKNWDNQFMMD